jgi:hypothetical protein
MWKKNTKKNVRQKGYSNKLFITQQLSREDKEEEEEEEHDSKIWEEEFYLMYNGYYHSNQDLWGGDGGFYFDSYY